MIHRLGSSGQLGSPASRRFRPQVSKRSGIYASKVMQSVVDANGAAPTGSASFGRWN
jgi:hypothetical protein